MSRLTDGEFFALKIFELKGKSRKRKSVVNEIRMLGLLRCEQIVNCVEAFDFMNHIYVVLELLTGGQLFHKIQQANGHFSAT